MLDLRHVNAERIEGLKKSDYESWHVVRHGRVKELRSIIDGINWNFNRNSVLDTYITYNKKYFQAKISRGASKAVIVFNKIVIKGLLLDRIRYDFLGNQVGTEVEMFQKVLHAGEGEEKHLCPVLKYYQRENISIMPKCEKVGVLSQLIEETGESREEWIEFLEKYRINDVWRRDGNAGILNGKVVLIDYGLNKDIW